MMKKLVIVIKSLAQSEIPETFFMMACTQNHNVVEKQNNPLKSDTQCQLAKFHLNYPK